MLKHPAVLLCAGAIVLGISACGSSSSSSSTSGPASVTSSAAPAAASSSSAAASAPSSGASHSLAIAANSTGALNFDKSSLAAKAGTMTIAFTNAAPEAHNFTLQSASGSTVGATPTFKGGTKTLTVKLKPGKYTYFCTVPGHRQGGMQGTLTVN